MIFLFNIIVSTIILNLDSFLLFRHITTILDTDTGYRITYVLVIISYNIMVTFNS